MTTSLSEFSLVLPDNWLPLDVTGGQRINDEVEHLLARGALTDESFRTHRGMLERQLRAVLRSVRREPVAMAAVLVSILNDVLPLFASLTVAVTDSQPDLLDRYRAKPGCQVEHVLLPQAGGAVALRSTDSSTDHTVGLTVHAAVFQWLIPLPRNNKLAILTCVSPDTEPVLVEAFADLFSAIAESFSTVDGGGADVLD